MISTGIKGFDDILTGLRVGDNVVLQVDHIQHYQDFVTPYIKQALAEKKKIIYLRFAEHDALLEPSPQIEIKQLNARAGFEVFTTQVHNIITEGGYGAYYVFDCLSDLLGAWATDLMIGNFFMVTCPYLFELDTITYFALLRDHHSFKTIARIRSTTQLLIDVYCCEGNYYIHPLKVWNRYSPTMFLPHIKESEERFVPITDSVNASQLLSHISSRGTASVDRKLDYWDRLFLDAEGLMQSGAPAEKQRQMLEELSRILMTRDERIRSLVLDNFNLADLLFIKSRIIGTGLVGGKTVGMLLARNILSREKSFSWSDYAEPHDSFYIGSDVFYAYIVENGWWKLRMQQKTKEHYFDAAAVLKEKLARGKFPDEIREQFQQMIEYFGTSPFIVRSSSLLEDGYGNAFAGKYESVFCANQGTPEQRYVQFVEAVRRIYASTMNEDALTYRKQRGLDMLDEQMALLVQRVSGSYHQQYFFPDVAGVGISYNTYVWSPEMKPEAGMLRIVFGLGTRAVDRVEGDYPRIAALDDPLRKPHSGMQDARKFSQHDVDLIDIAENKLTTVSAAVLLSKKLDINIQRIAVRDHESINRMRARGGERKDYWLITFDKLFSDPEFTETVKKILKTLEDNYRYPVDIEFTLNFTEGNKFKINLLQCRPLQTRGLGSKVEIPRNIAPEKILFSSAGYFFGGNVSQRLQRIIFVQPEKYSQLSQTQKYDIARVVGKLNKQIISQEEMPTLLMGPGRWGTSTPSLGVPVNFAEISNVSVMTEIAFTSGNLMPELSFGTHFFQDLVETNIFYLALFPEKEGVVFNDLAKFDFRNMFNDLVPEFSKYQDIISVYDVGNQELRLMSDVLQQQVVCFLK